MEISSSTEQSYESVENKVNLTILPDQNVPLQAI